MRTNRNLVHKVHHKLPKIQQFSRANTKTPFLRAGRRNMATVEEIRNIINEALGGVKDDIAGMKADEKVYTMICVFCMYSTYIISIGANKLLHRMAKQANSMKGRDETLEPVPLPDGNPSTAPYSTIAKLIVVNNEKLPYVGGAEIAMRNDWNTGIYPFNSYTMQYTIYVTNCTINPSSLGYSLSNAVSLYLKLNI
jgi:hypothetical protein